MARFPGKTLLTTLVLAFAALPLRAETEECGTAYSGLQAEFTEYSGRLAPLLCKHPNQFQTLARQILKHTNARIASFNLAHPAGSCDPDVPSPVPEKSTAEVMTVLQDAIGAIPLERYCNNQLDGNQLCGNSRVDPGEVCDSGNLSGQSCESLGQGAGNLSCSTDCKRFQLAACAGPAYCGNGRRDVGEDCDTAGNTAQCNFDCTANVCGDGLVNPAAGEECEANSGVPCTSSCTLALCGNGRTDLQAGEQCDDGNASNTDSCTNSCRLASCGDAITSNLEQCDDGNSLNGDSCLNNCTFARCGDGNLHTGVEQCDDGNNVLTDSCPAHCEAARCGDGHVWIGIESCDDRNTASGDGCSASCQIEP